ncbi:MAG: type II toxin-antitoxin system VapC family toxin [Pseudomonadota bacterium]
MIILDTNVVSEFMGSPPASAVLDWLNAQESESLHFTAVSVAEITFGLRVLPAGKRRDLLSEQFERFLARAFATRILPFDLPAAKYYGELCARRRRLGRPISVADAQIASIAAASGFSVATRNIDDFEACDVSLIDPFTSAQ